MGLGKRGGLVGPGYGFKQGGTVDSRRAAQDSAAATGAGEGTSSRALHHPPMTCDICRWHIDNGLLGGPVKWEDGLAKQHCTAHGSHQSAEPTYPCHPDVRKKLGKRGRPVKKVKKVSLCSRLVLFLVPVFTMIPRFPVC